MMKTAEVAVEHVLTGVLALCAFMLPFFSGPEFDGRLLDSQTSVAVLGLAYLVGIVFDRLTDTMLSPLEQSLRLKLAAEFIEKKLGRYDGDPFPQDKLEYELRKKNDGRTDWMDSLRSRVRTARGLTIMGLPAAMGIAIYLTDPQPEQLWGWPPYTFVGLNFVFLFLSVVASSIRLKPDSSTYRRLCNVKMVRLARMLESVKTKDLSEEPQGKISQSKTRAVTLSVFYFFMWLTSVAVICKIYLRWSPAGVAIVLLILCATYLMFSVWHRITETQMRFIYQGFSELPKSCLVNPFPNEFL
jgi:hypothetical protein